MMKTIDLSKRIAVTVTVALMGFLHMSVAGGLELDPRNDPTGVVLVQDRGATPIVVDTNDYPVVVLAANLLADDIQRVAGQRPVVGPASAGASFVVIAGTMGHSAPIDRLAAGGCLKKLDALKGRWEATLSQIVTNPFPGVERALVIVGSDRRGTAYGLMQLSEKIGVSPWYWWADVPVSRKRLLTVKDFQPQIDEPGVKYRGIFINDEDWGLKPWASKTFDPGNNIGPKTYEKVFELMLRLRLNYLWPAMHACTTEFGKVPENVRLAGRYGIVMGSTHCEPMLYNNVRWNKAKGPWDYKLNRDVVFSCMEAETKARGLEEAVWTLGIRGVHDSAMQGSGDSPDKIRVMEGLMRDQQYLLAKEVTRQWGPVAQCFVPYKEVLPMYNAGLKVPPEATLVWADDNFGYLRRLSSPEERTRPGGAGIYYHLSYLGQPRSYLWINTTAPALMWLEMKKAWQNEARTIWMLNVGDIKPAEIGIDFFARLAWNPDGFGADSQPVFLHDFAARNFGAAMAAPTADFLMEYYRLGTIRKPEFMTSEWAASLPADQAARLENDYRNLLERAETLMAAIPLEARDAFMETVAFPARGLGAYGLIFMVDRKVQKGLDVEASQTEINRWHDFIVAQVRDYNTNIAGGKWKGMIPGREVGAGYSGHVVFPWIKHVHKSVEPNPIGTNQPPAGPGWRDAATCDRQTAQGAARWSLVSGLGRTARAMSLQPAGIETSWANDGTHAPRLEYDFQARSTGDAEALVDFLPTYRLVPGMKLRIAVSVDNGPSQLVEVPGSDGSQDEKGKLRSSAVQNNMVRVRLPLPGLVAGKHTFIIRAVDPGVVIDQVSLP